MPLYGGGRRSNKYLVDHMLLRLGKWMRIMGIDTENAMPGFDDNMLGLYCNENQRILVTRDIEFSAVQKNSILIRSTDIREQIKEINLQIPVKRDDFLTRCVICNLSLIPYEQTDNGLIHEDVIGKRLQTCPKCGRIFWEGSHTDNMLKILKECGVYT